MQSLLWIGPESSADETIILSADMIKDGCGLVLAKLN
jgi:hypothetical protein